jgi:hypothetical protein
MLYLILCIPALALLSTNWMEHGWVNVRSLLLTAVVMTGSFLCAHHVLAEAYREKIVEDTYTTWEYASPQGFSTPMNSDKIWFCEPIYRNEDLYHAMLWLLPVVLLFACALLLFITRPRSSLTLRRLFLSAAALYPLYLFHSYYWLTNSRSESRFYVSTTKPPVPCPSLRP